MYDIVLCFISSFLLTYFAIPSIINIAAVKKLVDIPDERRAHTVPTPSLGGIAIFGGVLFSIILWTPFSLIGDLQYILSAAIIIFLIGAKDDILPTSAIKKMLGQLFAASILVFKANVMITSLYGIFGIYELPYWFAVIFSLFIILVILNAFNLIDGIDGLAGTLGVLITMILGLWFWAVAHTELSLVAFAMTGALVAFLNYNFTPAKIFMGDTGSLMVGLIVSILIIKFIEIHRISPDSIYAVHSAPAVAIAIIIYPLFDTLRVFTLRILNKKSPFSPDRRHIHHALLDLGLTHMQATFIINIFTVEMISIALFLQHIGSFYLILIILGLSLLFAYLVHLMVVNKQNALGKLEGSTQ